MVLPSTATTSRATPRAQACTHREKHTSKASGSISMNTRRKVSCEGMPFGRASIRQGQEGLQPGLRAAPIERDVLPALGAGDHRTDCDHQDVDELMIAPAPL